MNLIEWLTSKQTDLRLSDAKFADKLNISESFWCLLRNGKRRPTLTIVRNAVEAFPAEREEILACALVLTTVNSQLPNVNSQVLV